MFMLHRFELNVSWLDCVIFPLNATPFAVCAGVYLQLMMCGNCIRKIRFSQANTSIAIFQMAANANCNAIKRKRLFTREWANEWTSEWAEEGEKKRKREIGGAFDRCDVLTSSSAHSILMATVMSQIECISVCECVNREVLWKLTIHFGITSVDSSVIVAYVPQNACIKCDARWKCHRISRQSVRLQWARDMTAIRLANNCIN